MFLNDIRNIFDIPWNDEGSPTATCGATRRSSTRSTSLPRRRRRAVPRASSKAGRRRPRACCPRRTPATSSRPPTRRSLKCSHLFNVLDARGALSRDRARRVHPAHPQARRALRRRVAVRREAAGFPLLPREDGGSRVSAPLLLEIGCEEIPARMIPRRGGRPGAPAWATILDGAGLAHGPVTGWGGSRRLAVRVEDVPARQPDRDEQVLGPAGRRRPSRRRHADRGRRIGFARKQGIDAGAAGAGRDRARAPTPASARSVPGKPLERGARRRRFPRAVAAMSFPKTMRWADGRRTAGCVPCTGSSRSTATDVLPLTLFGVAAGPRLARPSVPGPRARRDRRHADDYVEALREGARARRSGRAARARSRALLARPRRTVRGHARRGRGAARRGRRSRRVAGRRRRPLRSRRSSSCRARSWSRPCGTIRSRSPSQSRRPACSPRSSPSPTPIAIPRGHVRRGNEWVVVGPPRPTRASSGTEDRKRTLALAPADDLDSRDVPPEARELRGRRRAASRRSRARSRRRWPGRIAIAREREVGEAARAGQVRPRDRARRRVPRAAGDRGRPAAARRGRCAERRRAPSPSTTGPPAPDDAIPATRRWAAASSLADRLDTIPC